MENHPDKSDTIEYVEAEPIEPGDVPAPQSEYQQFPFPNQVYYTKANCFPCCGPFGCLSLILVVLLIFTDINTRPLIFALGIFALVSFLARLFAPRRL